MQTDFSKRNWSEIPKQVRNYSYKQTMNNNDTFIQRELIKKIILGHPEGITDIEICVLTGISKSSVTARRNEILEVGAVGIAKLVDEYGEHRFNTLWGKP